MRMPNRQINRTSQAAAKALAYFHLTPQQSLYLVYAVAVACLLVLSPRLFSLAYGYIDPSFNYGVNEAAASGKAFGTQFISTYGPLGWLVADYLPKYALVANLAQGIYAVLLGIGAYLFIRLYVPLTGKKVLIALTVLLYALAITNGGGSIEWGYIMVFILYCFILLKLPARLSFVLLMMLTVTAALFSLTKFTLGFSALVALFAVCLLSLGLELRKRLTYTAVVTVVYLVVFLGLGRHLGIQSFAGYIKTAFIESNNFNTAMALYDKQTFMATIFVAVILLLLALWPLLHGKRDMLKLLFIIPVLFTLWKYCVVRQDGHILRLLQVALPLSVILYFSFKARFIWDRRIILAVFVLSAMAMFADKIPFYGPNSFYQVMASPLANVVKAEPVAAVRISQQKRDWAVVSAMNLGKAALPASMRNTIGKDGVDVFPYEASVIAANDLRWQNRPSPFSFETYDPYLDNLNASFYAGSQAPQYVLWHNTDVQSIDGRHVLWDEPATFRALLDRYQAVDSSANFILLKKLTTPTVVSYAKQQVVVPGEKPMGWQKLNTHDADPLTLVSLDIRPRLYEKLQAAAVRGADYYLELKTASHKVYKYRFIPENSEQGYLVEGLPVNWNQLIALLQNHANPSTDPIEQYRVVYN